MGRAESKNGYRYTTEAQEQLTAKTNGAKFFVNHPASGEQRDGVRDIRHWAGLFSNAKLEGEKVIAEARAKFAILHAHCVHRTGMLEIGECAVWVGVSSAHRDEAFIACRYIIDQVKVRLPIWKKEHYADGNSGWVNCERCAEHAHPSAVSL